MKKYAESNVGMWWVIGVIVVSLVGLFGWVAKDSFFAKPVASKSNREVAMTCTTDMATQFHIHSNLQIVINGQAQEMPMNIGITPTCMYALHTHDGSGVIHVESPEERDFTLGDFFAVWNKSFSKDQILDYKTDETHTIRQTINGNEVQDFENTVLRDEDKIIIYYEEKKAP